MKYLRYHINYKLILLTMLLSIGNKALCQKEGPIPVNAPYTLQYSYVPPSKNTQGVYKVFKSGNSANDELVSWNIVVLVGKEKRVENRILKMEIRRGSSREEKQFLLNKDEEIFKTFEGDNITPKKISLPTINDFNPSIRKAVGPILEGETVTLLVNPSKEFDNIEWVWKNGNKGESQQIEAYKTTVYSVYGQYKGTNFRTNQKSIKVNVNRIADVLDYEISGPLSPVPDTNAVNLSLNIQKNLFQNDLQWVWKNYRDEIISRNKNTVTIEPNPFIEDGRIKLCPYTNDRQFACKTFLIPLKKLPPPSEFNIQIPQKLYTDEWITLRAVSINWVPDTKWTWSINGRKINTTLDTILVRPTPGMIVTVYPTLYRRGGILLQKQFKLNNVITRTTLPTSIIGKKRFCGIPTRQETFQLESAILGNDSEYWLVMENNKEVTRFKGNTFNFLPKKSGSYILTADRRPDLKFNFSIEVIEIPKGSISIEGPPQVCESQPFVLTLNGFEGDEKFKWRWEKSSGTNNAERKLIGNGRTLRDSIQSTSTYYVKGEYNGCIIQDNVVRKVFKIDAPLMPATNYQYLDKSQEKAKFFVYNYNNKNSYQWSNDRFSTIYSEGESISNYRLKKGINTFSVRYKDECGIESPTAYVSVTRKKFDYFFINAGIGFSTLTSNRSYAVTLGSRSWYFRGKTSMPFIFKGQYQTTVASTALQISEQSRVVNYPRSTGTYYIVNGNNVISRISVTTGFIAGFNKVKFYVGGGIGKADLLWGLDIHNYAGNTKEKEVWARNIDLSANGPEFEAGIFLKLGKINFMAGGSLVYDSKISKPYNEFQIGIGFSTK